MIGYGSPEMSQSGEQDPHIVTDRATTSFSARTRVAFGVMAAGITAAALWPAPLAAQGRLEAKYEVSLAGIVIGKGDWLIDISDDQYTSAARGGTTGMLKWVSDGRGTTISQGRIVNGQPVPVIYQASYTTDKKNEVIRIGLANTGVKDFSIEPQPPVVPERVAVTEAHLRNAVDPLMGSMVRVAGNGDPVSADACRGGVSVFDGRLRYDLKLDFKRIEMVRSEKGYRGPVVVCAVYFTPVAGYIPGRPVVKHLEAQRDMEAWFAPVAGTRFVVPYKLAIPTPFGPGVLEATQFVTTATPAKAAAKTQ